MEDHEIMAYSKRAWEDIIWRLATWILSLSPDALMLHLRYLDAKKADTPLTHFMHKKSGHTATKTKTTTLQHKRDHTAEKKPHMLFISGHTA